MYLRTTLCLFCLVFCAVSRVPANFAPCWRPAMALTDPDEQTLMLLKNDNAAREKRKFRKYVVPHPKSKNLNDQSAHTFSR